MFVWEESSGTNGACQLDLWVVIFVCFLSAFIGLVARSCKRVRVARNVQSDGLVQFAYQLDLHESVYLLYKSRLVGESCVSASLSRTLTPGEKLKYQSHLLALTILIQCQPITARISSQKF